MKKPLLLVLLLLSSIGVFAAELPTTSTASEPVWYFIKFMNGSAVLEAKTSGAKVATAAMTGTNDQLWRVEGSKTAGYKFVSRSGMTLYTSSTAKEGMFYASTSASSNSTFNITACTLAGYTNGFVIAPKANSGVYMNQWGGAGAGKELGLWSPVDDNCPVTFYSEDDYLAELKKSSLPLIPMPTNMTLGEGSIDALSLTTIVYPSAEYKALAEQFAEFLGGITKHPLTVTDNSTSATGVVFLKIANNAHDEGYQLSVKQEGAVVISAKGAHGLFNGLTTLRQLYYHARYTDSEKFPLPLVEISDQPRFGYRGFMLDIARHYFDKAEGKKILDVMALYKISKFHWHLTDDQGWRIQIPEYPLLTEVGAIRSSSNTKTNPRFYDDTEYGRGMYYTLDDLREIVAYAQKLHIDIMPEIDLPGHMVAAITSYPDDFACAKTGIDDENKNGYTVRIKEGISKDVLNVAKPEVMDFLKCVLRHMAEVFPYPVIHIGGDECPTDAWQQRVNAKDKQFTDWMAANKLSSVNDIQPWLVNELGQWLKKEYGKDVVCWNELTNHWNSSLATQPIIMCYSDYGKNAMKAATNLGMRTIYTGCWPFYLDMYQTYAGSINAVASPQFDDPYTGGYGNNTLQAVYEATPTSSIAGKENLCLGVGANLWTETVCNNKEAEHQFFPRMLALAEVGWLPESQKSWISFRKRVQTHFKVMDEFGINYATYDLEQPQLDVLAAARQEAERLLQDAQPDAVGYPSAGAYDSLRQALAAVQTEAAPLESAIAAFKAAPITQPQEGKTYRIISASVAWGRDYAGSALYYFPSEKNYRFHYTAQTESEELFYFQAYNDAWRIRNRVSGKPIYLGSIDSKVAAGTATTVRIDAATVGSTNPQYYDYIPGVVTISAKSGYTVSGNSTKRLNAQPDGYAYVKSDATVGHTGTWRIVEVTDFRAELAALVRKCSIKGILTDEIVNPASLLLDEGGVITEATYEYYAALYAKYLGISYSPNGIKGVTTDNRQQTTDKIYDLQGRHAAPRTTGILVGAGSKTIR